MKLEIITPDKVLFTGEVNLIQLPGTMGSFEIMKNHAPIISSLEKGRVKIKDKDDKVSFIEINGGTLQVENNNILILTD
jgi:F-type H+-transporting ATPase subunit epsilon